MSFKHHTVQIQLSSLDIQTDKLIQGLNAHSASQCKLVKLIGTHLEVFLLALQLDLRQVQMAFVQGSKPTLFSSCYVNLAQQNPQVVAEK